MTTDRDLTLVRKRTPSSDLFGDALPLARSVAAGCKGRAPQTPLEILAVALLEQHAVIEVVNRDFYAGSVKPTHHRCRHCVIAAGNTERAWIAAEQYTDAEIETHTATCPNDPILGVVGELREKLAARQPELLAMRAERDRVRSLAERAANCLEAGSDRRARLEWARGLRDDLAVEEERAGADRLVDAIFDDRGSHAP